MFMYVHVHRCMYVEVHMYMHMHMHFLRYVNVDEVMIGIVTMSPNRPAASSCSQPWCRKAGEYRIHMGKGQSFMLFNRISATIYI